MKLTEIELNAGGWTLSSTSIEDMRALKSKGLDIYNKDNWADGRHAVFDCRQDGVDTCLDGYVEGNKHRLKQIHRIGDDFYWGRSPAGK